MFNKKEYMKTYQKEHIKELKEYKKKWYLEHKEKHNRTSKEYRKTHKEVIKKYTKDNIENIKRNKRKYRKLHPWASHYYSSKTRCNNSNQIHYKNYGGRGIKLLMTKENFKYLWFRDKAYLLKHPSIDRIDNDGDYTLENCRFIELSENIGKGVK